ncbi:MAG TPA: acetamidase/formamidase family protein [Puia sp.]|nr:acetamidase/formamidase family protein [Puia sp.]
MKYPILIFLILLSKTLQSQTIATSANHSGKLIHFTPSSFTNQFSLNVNPVLRINPGDTVSTETIDALGFDKNGTKRQKGGNPLTGPFYIENASTGDIIAVTLIKVSLNRSYAYTTQDFVSRSMPKSILNQWKRPKLIRWKLDAQNGFAFPDTPYEHLQSFKVPLNPFLGCIGVAPASKNNEELSFFSGSFGGNMDFSGIAESSTVYLPVLHDGAYLYIGDGHALQGDGELAGNALETSLDIDFTVRLIKNPGYELSYPRIENQTYMMAIGLDKNLDHAFILANTNLLDWLQTTYKISLEEATQVMSTSVEYTIAEVADKDVGVVAKIQKEILKGIKIP